MEQMRDTSAPSGVGVLVQSDMCIENRRNPNTDPWGTPLQT